MKIKKWANGSMKGEIAIGTDNSKMNEATPIPEVDLASLINIREIQSIMNDFYSLTNMVTAILDLKGKVIESTGWQDICTKFHRVNPQTACNCTESDLFLANNLKPGEFIDYKCKNGLWDVVTPLYVGDKHLGNIYTGQFFYDDDQIDEDFFIKQAETYGFDRESYLGSFRRIPRYNRETVRHLMSFLIKFTTYISKISFLNIQLEKEIRERRQVEEALKKSETRLRTVIRAIPDLVWLKDPRGVYLFCNSRFEQFFGSKEEDIIGKTDRDFMTEKEAAFFHKHDIAAMDRGEPTRNEERVKFVNNGHCEILETVKTPLYWNDGQLAGVLGVGRDITERKRSEKELRESEEKLRLFTEHAPASLAMFDSEMRYIAVSRRWMSNFNIENQDIIGRSHYDVFPEITDRLKDIHNRGLKGEVIQADEDSFERKDGTVQWLRWEIRPWFRADNTVGGVVIFTEDLTERKRMEKERDILNNQLIEAQKMEALGRLAGGVAHDYNNMLSVIMGYGEMALEKSESIAPIQDDIKQILQAAQQSMAITRQLLAFARRQVITPKVLDLNEAVTHTLKILQRLIGENIALSWNPRANLWPIKMDPGQIEQILANLCVNARDSIENVGKIIIETDRKYVDEEYCAGKAECIPGEFTMLAVSDNGCGIDKETLIKIYEPFFTTKKIGAGTGLGLATVHGIVKQNNGFINVYSEPEKGTTFRIYFPRHTGRPPEKPKMNIHEIPKSHGETVLVVEDEKSILELVEKILDRLDYRVLTAGNPIEALDLAKAQTSEISLLITDVIMPEMNGRELAQQLQTLWPELKCLYMSGYTDDVIAHHGVLEEGVNFIQKPFAIKEFAAKVSSVLHNTGENQSITH